METENNENAEEIIPPRNIKTSFLDTFNKLTLDKEKLRLKAGIALINHLTNNNNSELNYTLRRLIRGLGANSNEIKCRYYSVLVALLTSVPDVTMKNILDIVEKELNLSASNSKSENGDALFGQLLTSGALIRAGIFNQANDSEKQQMLEMLLSAGKKRSYLHLASVMFILELCDNLEEDQFKAIIWPTVKESLPKTWQDQTIDSVYLFLLLKKKYPNYWRKLIKGFDFEEVLCKENLQKLADILINTPAITSLNHPLYVAIPEELTKMNLSVEFVNEVDKFLENFNYNRHMAATKILHNMIASLMTDNYENLPLLLTRNYMQQTVRYLKTCKNNKEDLQENIQKLFDLIVEIHKRDDMKLGIVMLKKFLFHPKIFAIDKTSRSLIAELNVEDVTALADICRGVYHKEKQSWTNNNKMYASNLLSKLLTHPRMQSELQWKTEQLKFLMELALIKKQHISVDLSGRLKDTFFRALDLKLAKLEDLRGILSSLVQHVATFVAQSRDQEEIIFRRPLNSVALEIWQRTFSLIQKLENKSKIKQVTLVFLVLFLHMSLQLFNEVKLATNSLDELLLCYQKIKQQNSEEIPWIEVVVDLFLNLLSRNQHLLRSIICSVFPHLCKYMNATALHQILFVLDPDKEENPLSMEMENEEFEDDGETDDDDEVNSDSSSNNNSESESDEEETVNDKLRMALQVALKTTSDDEESIDIDEMSETEGQRLDEALAVAFKQFKPNLGKNTKKEKREKLVVTHFRLRVLDLLDIYLDSGPSMFLCLEIMPPLLRLLEFCAKDPQQQEPLLGKVRSILQKLCGLKKFASFEDVDRKILCDLLRSLLLKKDAKDLADKVSECCSFVVRCAQLLINNQGDEKLLKKINKILADALEAFLSNHNMVCYLLIKSVLQSTWIGNSALIKSLVTSSFNSEIRMYKRVQNLDLLRTFLSNCRSLQQENAEIFQNDVAKIVENARNILADDNDEAKVTQVFLRSLFNVLCEIRKKFVDNILGWAELTDCLQKYGASLAVSQDAKCAFRNLCKILDIQNVSKAEKRKLSAAVEDSAPKIKRVVKMKRKNTKINKEKRHLRMQALSEGVKVINFSSAEVKLDGHDVCEDDVIGENSVKKKVKDMKQ